MKSTSRSPPWSIAPVPACAGSPRRTWRKPGSPPCGSIAEGHRAGEIIGRIRDLAKKAPPQKDWLDLNATIRDVLALASSEVQRHGVVVETHLAADVPLILGDRIQLQQVLLNLLMNAIEAMSGVGAGPRELWVSSELVAATEVVIAVRDSGPGLDPQSLDRLFEAFYTTKPHGLGLGLAISRSDYRGARRPAVGDRQCAPRRRLAVHAADRERGGGHDGRRGPGLRRR